MINIQNEIEKRLATVISHVCQNPLIHVSETDIHSLLFHKLSEIPMLDPFGKLRKTGHSIGRNVHGNISSDRYKTMLLHKEYGHNNQDWGRSDIVIFDKDDVPCIDDPINLKRGDKYLMPSYIFEFGTEKAAGYKEEYLKHMRKDYEKLCNAKIAGYLVHIQRFIAKSAKGRRLDMHQMRKNEYKQETISFWKEKLRKCNVTDKIKLAICFIEIGTSGRKLRHKVDMFNPRNMEWRPVSMQNIENRVREYIS